MADSSTKWENYAKFHRNLVHTLSETFKEMLPTWDKIKDPDMDPIHGLKVLGIVNKLGIAVTCQMCSIYMNFHKKFPEIIGLHSDRELAPLKAQSVQECNGIVIKEQKILCWCLFCNGHLPN